MKSKWLSSSHNLNQWICTSDIHHKTFGSEIEVWEFARNSESTNLDFRAQCPIGNPTWPLEQILGKSNDCKHHTPHCVPQRSGREMSDVHCHWLRLCWQTHPLFFHRPEMGPNPSRTDTVEMKTMAPFLPSSWVMGKSPSLPTPSSVKIWMGSGLSTVVRSVASSQMRGLAMCWLNSQYWTT